jgi:hypothetical protein
MTFREWRIWFKELPWTVKWFVILVLFRPIIDNFYWVKDINPLFSPLNIVGVLTPVLIIWSLSSKSIPSRKISTVDTFLMFYGFLVILNSFVLDVTYGKIELIGNTIKFIIPPFLFIYLRRAIRSERDLNGILTSFLYSGIYILGMLGYETFVNPLQESFVTEGRGGGARLIGEYNDMMNYAIYIVGTLLISGYFFLRNIYRKTNSKNPTLKFYSFLALVFFGLVGIKHVSTWSVCLAIFALIILFNLKNFKGFLIIFFMLAIFGAFFGDIIYKDQIEPLINKEMNVVEGDAETGVALNGRVGRWERYFDIWFSEMTWVDRMFGVGISGHKSAVAMVSAGMHSDFVRNLFLAGILGITFYLLFLFQIFLQFTRFKIPEKFLILGALAAIVLHSVSTLPLMYSSYMYLLLSIFSYACLPLRNAYSSLSWKVQRKPKQVMRFQPTPPGPLQQTPEGLAGNI